MGKLTSWTTGDKLWKSLKVGDIVEINRMSCYHFIFHIGDGICVHVIPSNGIRGLIDGCGSKLAERLTSIAGDDPVRVNNCESAAKIYNVSKRPENEAVRLAISGLPVNSNGDVVLDDPINVRYMFMGDNCETWCTHWRYGHCSGWSTQAINGPINITVGTAERISNWVIYKAESIFEDDDADVPIKVVAATAVVIYGAVNLPAAGVRIASDFAANCLTKWIH